ncbi:MAG: hypothetical protein R3F38_18535 [Gammaproteobacteria bacterium]
MTSGHHLASTTHLDFLRLHVSYFGMIAVWCTLMLLPVKRLLWPRIGVVLTLLYFAATNLSYSAAIYYTGVLYTPLRCSYYAGLATGNLPLSLAVTEWLTLAAIPALFLASAFWKLRTLYRLAPTTARNHATVFVILMTATLVPVTRGGERNLMRPSYVYQLGNFLQEKSIWPQAVAVESYDRNAQALTATRKQHPNIVFIAGIRGRTGHRNLPCRQQSGPPYLNRLAQSGWVVRNAARRAAPIKGTRGDQLRRESQFSAPDIRIPLRVRERCLADLLAEQVSDPVHAVTHRAFREPAWHGHNWVPAIHRTRAAATGYQLASYFRLRRQHPAQSKPYLAGTADRPVRGVLSDRHPTTLLGTR